MTLEQEYYYNTYLKSPEWASKREYVFKKYNGKCAVCGKPGTQVHHLRYRHNYETGELDENLDEDLILLCADHHSAYHLIETWREESEPKIRRELLKNVPSEMFVDRFIEYVSERDIAHNRNGINFANIQNINDYLDKFLESCEWMAPIYEAIDDKTSWKSIVQKYFAALHKAIVKKELAAGASRTALGKRYGHSCVSKVLEKEKNEQQR